MDDVVGYLLVLGLIVLPSYLAIRVLQALMTAVFQNQSVILAFPFP